MTEFTIQRILRLARRHHDAGRLPEAERLYRQALAREPANAQLLHLLGMLAGQLGRHDAAIELIGRAIQIAPDEPVFYCDLGESYRRAGRVDEAIAAFRRALTLNPNLAETFDNLGNALKSIGQLDEAIAASRRALTLIPTWAEAHNNLGVALKANGQLDEAIAVFRQALALNSNLPEVHFNLALALLARGEFLQGWDEYEWRSKCKDFSSRPRNFAHPQWEGEPLEGRTLLLHGEQGFGDTLQFIRYIPAHETVIHLSTSSASVGKLVYWKSLCPLPSSFASSASS